MSKAALRQKNTYDRGIKPRSFKVGNFVWRWYPPTACIKLGLGWTRPYQITYKCSDVTYKIKESPHSREKVVHVDHLKPYLGTVPFAWAINREPEVESEGEESFQVPELSLHDPEQDEDPIDISNRDGAINFKTPVLPDNPDVLELYGSQYGTLQIVYNLNCIYF